MKKVVIIGGGISGLSAAYFLTKEGCQVTLIDKGDLTGGASNINAGFITPSHIFSLASPDVVQKGLKWMWNSSSPFYIKPRLDLEFLQWAWKFKRAATREKVERSIPVIKEISLKSTKLLEEILDNLHVKAHYEKKGILTVFQTEKALREEMKAAERIRLENLEVEMLSRNQILELQPSLSAKINGGIYYRCDAHSTPEDVLVKLKSRLISNGVSFRLNEMVTNLEKNGRKISGVKTNKGFYQADELVLAAGTWTPQLAKMLGIRISMQGGKGYSMDVYRETGITIPAILAESKIAVTPMKGFTRFAGTMEFSGNNAIIRRKRVEAIARAVPGYYEGVVLTPEEIAAARSGLRPVTPDGLPYIGRTYRLENVVLAAGHAMIGWSLGAVTGKIVSQIVTGQEPEVNLKPFDPERFS